MKFLEKIKNIFRSPKPPTEVVFTKAEKLLILKNRAEKEYENELKKQGLPLPSQRSHHRNH